ncbi:MULTISPECIES: NAD(P)-dependent oxidoreductase [unclassified Methanoregula]|uniref:NAD-dependent epimerase/dehydratase family protein n=1 Tax=unclassified Methanoregula TaxID=2649730 RepID=UPI0009CC7F76|nr:MULTISPECIES: NAD-dependent epimerase/dehydratase family protein [unclassified Methanoregula]OPX64342.1 MAG: dTDP-glucose 4,6 dehydratase [Methanoregula sp. PtaB.Bin085]OPY33533.1 MAG: dTDP-glucose 4,6 dehydratase [Methanoregula sp. PtaU1.Bin006]
MSSLAKKTVLVTGATGFVGSNLLRCLQGSGADLHIIARTSSNLWRISDIIAGVGRHTPDLSDADSVKKTVRDISPDIIFHLATYGGSPREDNFRQIMESNFFGTVNLVDACKDAGFDLFVNTGTSSEYGIKSAPMKETDCLKPVNNYGISKAACTHYCQAVALNDNLPIVTLRLFSPYGDYEDGHRLVPSVILSCLQGKNPAITSRSFVRDFIYIDDVVDLYRRLAEIRITPGEIFNAGSGVQHSVGDVVDTVIRITGKPLEAVTGLPKRWPNEPEVWQADMSKTSTSLNRAPKYDLENGLRKTVEWFAAHQHLYRT